MAVRIVDRLEAVEVEIGDGQQLLAAQRLGHRLLHPVGQQRPIRQGGEQIEMGHSRQLLFMRLHRRDVGKQGDVTQGPPLLVTHRADGQQFRIKLAVLAAVPDFPAPVARFQEFTPHRLVKLGRMVARPQDARILADGFLPRIAGNPGECRIDVDDGAIGGGNRDALLCMQENAGGQLVFLFRALARVDIGDHTDEAQLHSVRIKQLPAGQVPPEHGLPGAPVEPVKIDRRNLAAEQRQHLLAGGLALGRMHQRDVLVAQKRVDRDAEHLAHPSVGLRDAPAHVDHENRDA